MTKRRVLLTLAALALSGIGVFLYFNVSMNRLRAGYTPWMEKLGRYRDGIEATRRAVWTRNGTELPALVNAQDPLPAVEGAEAIAAWAWRDLDRLHGVWYDVAGRPAHDVPTGGETEGNVTFVVDGFRADGARVTRKALVFVSVSPSVSGLHVAARIKKDLGEDVVVTPRFHDATLAAGLGAKRNDPKQDLTNRLIDGIWPGTGVAVLDFDQDGDEDLFVGDGVRSMLYENDGHGRFTDVTDRAGLGWPSTGLAAADVNGDGYPDIAFTDAFGPVRLFVNGKDGTFRDATKESGLLVPQPKRSLSFADVDRDGDLDLFICGTGDYYRQMPDPPFDANDGSRNELYLNDGKGVFTNVTEAWGVGGLTRWSLTALFGDVDDDGFQDLLVTNDFGLKNLYRNDGGKRFVDVTGKWGVEDRGYGMSGSFGDFDGDSRLDLYTTGTYTQWGFIHSYPSLPVPLPGRIFLPFAVAWMEKMCAGNSLFLNRGTKMEDVPEAGGARVAAWCWSAIAADLDGDGALDLYGSNGMWGDGRDRDREFEFWWETLVFWDDYIELKKTFDRKGRGVHGNERDVFFANDGKAAFTERSFVEGLDLTTNGRSAVAFDANGDGALDLFVRSVQAPEALFLGSRREGEHFLRLRLRGKGGNPDAIGARVTAVLEDGRTLMRETSNASSYLGSASPVVHLGLGKANAIKSLTVRWPSGKTEQISPVPSVDETVVLQEK